MSLTPSRIEGFLATKLSNVSDVSDDTDSPNTPTGLTHDLLVAGAVLATMDYKVKEISEAPFVSDADLYTLQLLNAQFSNVPSPLTASNPNYKGFLVDFSSAQWLRFMPV